MWHKDLLGLDAHDHLHYTRHTADEVLSGDWRVDATGSLRFGGVAGPLLQGYVAGATLYLTGSQHITSVLSVMNCAIDATKWLNISPTGPSGNALTGISLNPSSPMLTGNNATFYGITGAPIGLIGSGSSGAQLRGLSFLAAVGGGGGGATATLLASIWTRLGVVALNATLAKAVHFLADPPLIFAGAPAVTEYVGLELGDMGKHASIVDSYGLRIANMTLNTGVRRLLELGPASPFLRLVGGAVPPANTSHLWLDFGGTLRRVSRNGATGVLSAF